MCIYHCSAEEEKANEGNLGEKKTKKKKKKKKKDKKRVMAVKKEPGAAIIAKLHLADNGIDGLHTSDNNNRPALFDFLQLCKWSVTIVIVAVWISLGFVTFAGYASCIKYQSVRMQHSKNFFIVLIVITCITSINFSLSLSVVNDAVYRKFCDIWGMRCFSELHLIFYVA